jgi:hypothetical protein
MWAQLCSFDRELYGRSRGDLVLCVTSARDCFEDQAAIRSTAGLLPSAEIPITTPLMAAIRVTTVR